MPDREKVIKGLYQHCEGSMFDRCGECPYYEVADEPFRCRDALLMDVLALLREQEPRLMTLEEVKAFDWDYCYLEEERLPGKEYRAVCGDYALTCITWPCVASMRIQHGDDSYGKKWRCWTARPTDEQREAVKWDE
jgi:hypothetical protein